MKQSSCLFLICSTQSNWYFLCRFSLLLCFLFLYSKEVKRQIQLLEIWKSNDSFTGELKDQIRNYTQVDTRLFFSLLTSYFERRVDMQSCKDWTMNIKKPETERYVTSRMLSRSHIMGPYSARD